VVVVLDLNKNIGGLTDLAKKKARISRFAYPYLPPLPLSGLLVLADLGTVALVSKIIGQKCHLFIHNLTFHRTKQGIFHTETAN